jgi:hypothetical protein
MANLLSCFFASFLIALLVFRGLHYVRASPVVLYCKPESGKRWKDVNYSSCQQGRSLYSSFIYRVKPDFGRFLRGTFNQFWNVLLWKDTQVWKNDVLMITGLQAYKTTRDALSTVSLKAERGGKTGIAVQASRGEAYI